MTITQLARELRRNMTPSERVLWEQLRKRRLNGYRFVRQKPIVYQQIGDRRYFYILDFYNAHTRLAVELDGKVHESQRDYDRNRDRVLKEQGIRTLRIANEELSDMKAVKEKILRALASR